VAEKMSKAKPNRTQIYKLPNHSWHSAEFYPPGSKYDTPQLVVRRLGKLALVRNSTWEQAKQPRFDYSKKFCGENRPNDTWKPFDLWMWGEATIGILAQKARDGDGDAALELARLAGEATEHLTKVCKANPKLVLSLSRLRRAWPVIKHKKAKLSNDERDLFSAIQLGVDDFVELDAQTAKWKWDDAGKIAYSLLNYIRRSRGSPPHGFDNGAISKFVKEKLSRDFDDGNANVWWKVAKEILLFSYPEPQVIQELSQLVSLKIRRKKDGHTIDNPKRKSPGILKQEILSILESRFLAFAPNKSFEQSKTCPTSNG
jgi:hypothetical protein